MQYPFKDHFLTAAFGAVWVFAVVFGLWLLLRYESTPGATAAVSSQWPATSAIKRSADHPTLVMLAHPHCPCTRASAEEMAKIMARVAGKVNAYVLFLKPASSGADWENTGLRQTVARIPGVTVLSDQGGLEARRFGATTSGHTLLFSTDGRLLFSGGITKSRGHAGDNEGESAILALVNHQPARRTETLVFGCALASRSERGGPAICSN